MEIFLKLLEDESKLHLYLRKAMKYSIIVYLALMIYKQLNGSIDSSKIFILDTNTINLKSIFEELLSLKSLIPFVFIFISYTIFSLFEVLIRFVFFGLTQIYIERKFKGAYTQINNIDSVNDIGLSEFKDSILKILEEKIPSMTWIANELNSKIMHEVSKVTSQGKLRKFEENAENEFVENLDVLVEMSIIGFCFLFLFQSKILNFLEEWSFLYVICTIVMVLYPITRIFIIVFATMVYRLTKLLIFAGEKYFQLQEKEKSSKQKAI